MSTKEEDPFDFDHEIHIFDEAAPRCTGANTMCGLSATTEGPLIMVNRNTTVETLVGNKYRYCSPYNGVVMCKRCCDECLDAPDEGPCDIAEWNRADPNALKNAL